MKKKSSIFTLLWDTVDTTSGLFELAKSKKTPSKHPSKNQGVVTKNRTFVTLPFVDGLVWYGRQDFPPFIQAHRNNAYFFLKNINKHFTII